MSFLDAAGVATRALRTGVGSPVLAPGNDLFAARFTMAGTSGTTTYNVVNAGVETGEPDLGVLGGSGTVWWTWTPGVDGTATVTVPSGQVVDAYLDPGSGLITDLTTLGGPSTTDSVTFDIRTGETYAIRVYAESPTDSATHTLGWSTGIAPLGFTISTFTIPWTPSSVTAYVANDLPGATTVSLSYDGGATAQTATTDSEGNVAFPLLLPTLTVGSHDVTAVSSSGRSATIGFTVQNSEAPFVVPVDPSPPAVLPPAVKRWRLQDPVSGETFDFPINPKTEGAVVRPRTLQSHWTTAHDGQPIVFEGGRKARPWTLTGDLYSKADLEALQGWKRPYRIYITDDLGRTFVIKIRRVSSQPVRNLLQQEHHTYTLIALLFGVHST